MLIAGAVRVYVEANFVLELTFVQEQCDDCEGILALCEERRATLIIPAYSLVEPHEKLTRQKAHRTRLQRELDSELRQLHRATPYRQRIDDIENVAELLTLSSQEEAERFQGIRDRLLRIAEVIPLTSAILETAGTFELAYNLSPQDALAFASVIDHLRRNEPPLCCFINRNSKDFNSPEIIADLERFGCKMIPKFNDGYTFIKTQTGL